MKTAKNILLISPLIVLIFALSNTVNAQYPIRYSNTIEGQVFDENHQPVGNAFVELLDSYNALVARTRTTSQGKYTFRDISRGRFTVSVKPYGTNLMEDSETVEIYNQISKSEYMSVNFSLKESKSLRHKTPLLNEAVFAQEVPENAQDLYKKGLEKLKDSDEDGTKDLEAALKITPTYFYALKDLGGYYVTHGKEEKGYPYLLKAIDVYRRCGECYYNLTIAFSNLHQRDAAVKSGAAATALNPTSPHAFLLYGIVLRQNEQWQDSMNALLKARELFGEPDADVSWQLSMVYNRLGDNLKAAEELEGYLEVNDGMKKDEKEKVKDLIKQMRADAAKKKSSN